jgi:hypothetical protein
LKKHLILIALISIPAFAQHEHMQMSMPATAQKDLASEFLMGEASGTSHDPSAVSMHMSMTMFDKWMLMAHGNAFVSQVVQSGPRGGDQFFSTNWVMGMAERPLAGGHLMLRSMLSLEPLTVGKRGYPELYQVGEGLVDRQHPHDFFMELAAQFAVDIGHETVGYIYAAPVGDPALGPVAFPHRASAAEIPQAPLSHHLQDSTHIAGSVVTIGAKQHAFGLALSGFHGREPDNNRWNIDKGSIDSWSIRGTWDPTPNWSAQLSTGHLQHPEAAEPGNIQRTTASVAHSDGEWSSTLVWGWNRRSGNNANSLLAETNRRFNVSNYVTGRFETVRGVKALTGGYTKDVFRSRDLLGGVGGNVTVYRKANEHPLSLYLFARLRSPAP